MSRLVWRKGELTEHNNAIAIELLVHVILLHAKIS